MVRYLSKNTIGHTITKTCVFNMKPLSYIIGFRFERNIKGVTSQGRSVLNDETGGMCSQFQ